MDEIGIKSKERVAQFGEVYTPENIVNDMLDLVKDESYKLDSTFLEPACGNGNFLVKILERKLFTASQLDLDNYDINIFIAVSSIYAIDILSDNIAEAKKRMINIIKTEYIKVKNTDIDEELLKVIKFLLDTNIIWGDGLTGLYEKNKQEIIIAEWNINGDTFNRKDYTFNQLSDASIRDVVQYEYEEIHFMKANKAKKKKSNNSLFAEFGL